MENEVLDYFKTQVLISDHATTRLHDAFFTEPLPPESLLAVLPRSGWDI